MNYTKLLVGLAGSAFAFSVSATELVIATVNNGHILGFYRHAQVELCEPGVPEGGQVRRCREEGHRQRQPQR